MLLLHKQQASFSTNTIPNLTEVLRMTGTCMSVSDQSLVPEPPDQVQEAKRQDASDTGHAASSGSDPMVPPTADQDRTSAATGADSLYYGCQNPPRGGSKSGNCGTSPAASRSLARQDRAPPVSRTALLAFRYVSREYSSILPACSLQMGHEAVLKTLRLTYPIGTEHKSQ